MVGAALLHDYEALPVFSLDLPSILADTAFVSPEQCLINRLR
jgi:hypothetical protein